jgi:putative (di)nucleoside polyphosphate hydrolase
LPKELVPKLWGGKYDGQKQKWFAMKFLGINSDININTKHPEFSNWKWMTKERLLEHIVPFKREVYKTVLSEFSSIIDSN